MKPEKAEKPAESAQTDAGVGAPSVSANGVETYGSGGPQKLGGAPTGATTTPLAPSASKPKAKAEPAPPKEEEQDPPEVGVPVGAACKRAGCAAKYEGGKRDREREECSYHSGVAIFHEGSKVSWFAQSCGGSGMGKTL